MKRLLFLLLLAPGNSAFAQSEDSARFAELNTSAGQRWAVRFGGTTLNYATDRIHRYFVEALDAPQPSEPTMAGRSARHVLFNLKQGDGRGHVLSFTFTTTPDARSHEFIIRSVKIEGETDAVLPFFVRFWDNRFATTGKSFTYRMGSEVISYKQLAGGKAAIVTL